MLFIFFKSYTSEYDRFKVNNIAYLASMLISSLCKHVMVLIVKHISISLIERIFKRQTVIALRYECLPKAVKQRKWNERFHYHIICWNAFDFKNMNIVNQKSN